MNPFRQFFNDGVPNNSNEEGTRRQMQQRIRYLSHGHTQANMKIEEQEETIRNLRQQLRLRQARPQPDQTQIRELQARIETLVNENRGLKEKAQLQAGRAINWHNLYVEARAEAIQQEDNLQQIQFQQGTINAYQNQIEIIANDQDILAYFTELERSHDPFLLGLEIFEAREFEDEPEDFELGESEDEPEIAPLPVGVLKLKRKRAKEPSNDIADYFKRRYGH